MKCHCETDIITCLCLSQVRQEHLYRAIQTCHMAKGYSVETSCQLLHVSRSASRIKRVNKLGDSDGI